MFQFLAGEAQRMEPFGSRQEMLEEGLVRDPGRAKGFLFWESAESFIDAAVQNTLESPLPMQVVLGAAVVQYE